MGIEEFIGYLRDPNLLYYIRFDELQVLAQQYPYCQNIRVLLLQKSAIEKMPEYEELLHDAAAYSIDRNFLFQSSIKYKYQPPLPRPTAVEAADEDAPLWDTLTTETEAAATTPLRVSDDEQIGVQPAGQPTIAEQLDENTTLDDMPKKDLKIKIEESLQALLVDEDPFTEATRPHGGSQAHSLIDRLIAVTEPQDTPPADELPAPAILDVIIEDVAEDEHEDAYEDEYEDEYPDEYADEEDIAATDEPTTDEQPAGSHTSPDAAPHHTPTIAFEITTASSPTTLTDTAATHPTPKASFSSWLRQLKPIKKMEEETQLSDEKVVKEKTKTDAPAKIAKSLAKNSLVEDEEIATETLANLLEKQGLYERAIKMYERLRLLIPEKSAFFAAKIQELQLKQQ